MKLKSETKQVVEFLNLRFQLGNQDNKTVLELCKQKNLNYDMVRRGLQKLHANQVISRDSRGPNSRYQFPTHIGLGDIIYAIEGIDLDCSTMYIKAALDNIKI